MKKGVGVVRRRYIARSTQRTQSKCRKKGIVVMYINTRITGVSHTISSGNRRPVCTMQVCSMPYASMQSAVPFVQVEPPLHCAHPRTVHCFPCVCLSLPPDPFSLPVLPSGPRRSNVAKLTGAHHAIASALGGVGGLGGGWQRMATWIVSSGGEYGGCVVCWCSGGEESGQCRLG